ncbi:cystathionine gamma-synthase [Corynebacterium macginleyi]|uniref:cystathionine gamma-synthase n=1 Tax=Corynebacterium macginleyi TaxID=38290 RepID=UPI00190D162F|nr:cystathionine gamma-synthase [Corynebacterium macginleyi]MBK4151400.1 cystathionine gamma-synthase [Corynebacterium macginleyi]MBK4162327.1 cystathionine gamma-synthase [Corynebacterium macginleyi]MBK4167059.1 cystathionine gamma-synthase [Corynebacterium macginleyi]
MTEYSAHTVAKGFSSRSIHAGYHPDPHMGSINVPIYASTTFAQDGLAQLRGGFEYGRVANPTVRSLEKTLAALEGAVYARVFATGMAAADTVVRILVRPGDHVILGNDSYGGSYRLLNDFTEWGVDMSIVNTCDVDAVAAAVKDNTKLIWLETPTNPALNITDIASVAKVKSNAQVLVDNTFATPYLQNPLALGADHVLHSTTKYLGGHSDVLGGAVATNDPEMDEQLLYFQGNVGAVASPFDAYLTSRGIKTLGVRMDRHCANAQKVAEFLQSRPEVKQVRYPGLAEHPGHELAAQQMRGFGGMVSVRFHNPEHAKQICLKTRLICLAESLGGVESLIEHPRNMTHVSAEGSELAPPEDMVRISIGIEDIEDLLADLQQALDAL